MVLFLRIFRAGDEQRSVTSPRQPTCFSSSSSSPPASFSSLSPGFVLEGWRKRSELAGWRGGETEKAA